MKVIIIHGWGSNSSSDWFSWLKKELISKDFNVITPNMLNTDKPEINLWVNKLKELSITDDTIIVGHSIGCQTILRFLEKENIFLNKVILVAPWLNINRSNLDDKEWLIAKPWAETPIDLTKVKNKSNKFVIIYSENDPFSIPKDITYLVKELNAKKISVGKKGHICQDDGIVELPIILNEF